MRTYVSRRTRAATRFARLAHYPSKMRRVSADQGPKKKPDWLDLADDDLAELVRAMLVRGRPWSASGGARSRP